MSANNQLRREREQRGWSQQKVAESVGVTTRTISRWEMGFARPYPHFREQLCLLFEKNARELGLLSDHGLLEDPFPEKHEGPVASNTQLAEEKIAVAADNSSEAFPPKIYDPAIPPPLVGQSELIGRADLLRRVKQQLQAGEQVALTAINGLPGVGKTALAIAIAADPEIQYRYQDGILWAGLGPNADMQGLWQHWGWLLGMTARDMEGLSEPRAWFIALRKAIGQRRMLIVIDDAWKIEHVLGLQIGGPLCSHLVTTRLASLAVQVSSDSVVVVPELNEDDGITMLKRFAPEVVNQEPETARELVRLVGGLPLAQMLMGKYLHLQAMSGHPRRVQRALDQLRNTEQRMTISAPIPLLALPANLEQHTPWSLQAAIAVSDQQLNEQARRALRALSVFPAKPNGFSEEAALAVSHVPVEMLDILSDVGLLESWGADCYTLHQTIADYASIQLRAHLKEQDSAYDNLIDYYIDYVERNQLDFAALARERTNILAALDAAYTFKKQTKYLQLFSLFALAFLRLSDPTSYEKHTQRAYEMAQSSNNGEVIIPALMHIALLQDKRGEYDKSEENLKRMVTLVQQQQDHPMLGAVYVTQCRLLLNRCNYSQVEECARAALALGLRKQDKFIIYFSYVALGWAAGCQGRYLDLEKYTQEIVVRAEKDQSQEFLCFAYLFSGQLKEHEGEYTQAQEYAQKSFAAAIAIHYDEFACQALELLSRNERLQGKYEQAYEHALQGLAIVQQANIPRLIGAMHIERGEILLAQQKIKDAEMAFKAAQVATPVEVIRLQGTLLHGLARVEAIRGQLQAAQEYGRKSLELLKSIEYYEKDKVAAFMQQLAGSSESALAIE